MGFRSGEFGGHCCLVIKSGIWFWHHCCTFSPNVLVRNPVGMSSAWFCKHHSSVSLQQELEYQPSISKRLNWLRYSCDNHQITGFWGSQNSNFFLRNVLPVDSIYQACQTHLGLRAKFFKKCIANPFVGHMYLVLLKF